MDKSRIILNLKYCSSHDAVTVIYACNSTDLVHVVHNAYTYIIYIYNIYTYICMYVYVYTHVIYMPGILF